MKEAVAKSCSCGSLGLAFTAIGLFLMLLWASVQAVPASLESPLSEHRGNDLQLLPTPNRTTPQSKWDSSSLSKKLCKYFEGKASHKRMKHRSNVKAHSNDNRNTNEPTIRSLKDLHERQVRSFELGIVKKYPYDVNYETNYGFIRNKSIDDKGKKIMNNEESVSMENISESTLATFKESNVKTNPQKEASDKIYLPVNGEFAACNVISLPHPQLNPFKHILHRALLY